MEGVEGLGRDVEWEGSRDIEGERGGRTDERRGEKGKRVAPAQAHASSMHTTLFTLFTHALYARSLRTHASTLGAYAHSSASAAPPPHPPTRCRAFSVEQTSGHQRAFGAAVSLKTAWNQGAKERTNECMSDGRNE